MAKVAYVVNDALGGLCAVLGITTGYELLDGHYAFTDMNSYENCLDAVDTIIWELLDDDNPDNDETAYEYLDMLDNTDYTVMYWSTEKGGWV